MPVWRVLLLHFMEGFNISVSAARKGVTTQQFFPCSGKSCFAG
jgi:hypothetical protein